MLTRKVIPHLRWRSVRDDGLDWDSIPRGPCRGATVIPDKAERRSGITVSARIAGNAHAESDPASALALRAG